MSYTITTSPLRWMPIGPGRDVAHHALIEEHDDHRCVGDCNTQRIGSFFVDPANRPPFAWAGAA